jgi:hypothetical protein
MQGDYSKKLFYQKSEYEVQLTQKKPGAKKNLSFLAFKEEAIGVIQISSYNGPGA